MNSDPYKLERFVQAQEGVYPVALDELRRGCKRSHWMWYIFPQLKHLGHSYNAKYYGIADLDEARAYLAHPLLGQRLREASEALMSLSTSDAREVMGPVDAIKLRSSMPSSTSSPPPTSSPASSPNTTTASPTPAPLTSSNKEYPQ